jgi:hypothetical protein
VTSSLQDGTIGNEWVIKPVPSQVPLPATSSVSSSPFSSSSSSSSSSNSNSDSSRDDDEMFLEEDDVSVTELSHLKKRAKKRKTHLDQSQRRIHNNSQNLNNNTNHDNNNSNKRNRRQGYVEVLSGSAVTSVEEEHPGLKLTPSSHQLHPQDQPNTRIPKASELSREQGNKKKVHHDDSLYHKHAHFVFKKKFHPIREEPHEDFASLEPGHLPIKSSSSDSPLSLNWTLVPSASSQSFTSLLLANASSQVHRRSKRQSPDTVWPEVLLVVDYDSYLLHGGNSRDVKRYFISFWNGVDLRYKLLSHPRIRVSLAGMIVAKVRLNYCSNRHHKEMRSLSFQRKHTL